MTTLVITTTHERPKAFDILSKVIAKQTIKEFDWLIVTDGSIEGYTFPKSNKHGKVEVLRRDTSGDRWPSLNCNWLCAIDWILEHEDYDRFLVVEDDDYYHKEYIGETLVLLDKAELVGWHEDAYYYVLSRKARRFHNVGHASLAATAFKRSVLPFLRECCMVDDPFIDVRLWKGMTATSLMQQPPVTLASGQVINPPPVPYTVVTSAFKGKKLLADNFSGCLWGQKIQIGYDELKKLQIISNEPRLNDEGNVENEHPRHVGMKEPWHAGASGLSELGHDPRQAGGPDIFGDQLRKWVGKDADLYLQFTKDPPGRKPGETYPPNIMVPMPID